VLVKCIKAFGLLVPGDLAEVPDGASVDPDHWVVPAAAETPPEPSEPAAPAAFPPAAALTPKEM
jgi:hypothetical protein